LLVLGCAFGLALAQLSAAPASASLQTLADKPASLPLTATFEKGPASETGGPYVLKLTNTSATAVTASAAIVASVSSHASAKNRTVPAHTVEPGAVWAISDLASGDKVTVTADGFAPLELTVP